MTTTALSLLLLLNLCHWIGDYTHLSTPDMLQAKRQGTPIWPIWCHASVHAFLFLAVCLFFTSPLTAGYVFAFEVLTHFWIDVLKGRMNVWFPVVANPANKQHWYLFGFDQLLHQTVIGLIVYFLCK